MFFYSQLEYSFVLIFCIIIPLLFTIFYKPFKQNQQRLKFSLISIFLSSIYFLVWDVFATFYGHWSFNPDYILGFYIFNLPMEEVLFFFIIPFCCLFVWECLKFFKIGD